MQASRLLKHLDTIIAAIIGFCAIRLFTSYSGVGISPDSIMYASTATNIQAHWSLLTFNGTPLVFFPVFYPAFLALIQFVTKVDPFVAGSIINSCLFATVILITGWMLAKFITHSRIYKCLILIAIILSPALLQVYSFLWSETLFILLVMLFILNYHHYLQTQTTGRLLIIALVAALACITRYAGITLIGTGALMILLDTELPKQKKIKHIALFCILSISLLLINLAYNRYAAGLSTGTREPSITPLSENMYYVGTVLSDWGALGDFADHYAIPLTACVLLALMGILVYKKLRKQINSYENIIIAYDGRIFVDELAAGLSIATTDGPVTIDHVIVAAPCVEFSRYALDFPRDAKPDLSVTETVRFLHHGMRGFYARTGQSATLRVGDVVSILA